MSNTSQQIATPPIRMELYTTFHDFDEWVNKASSRTGGLRKRYVTLWLDKDGYAMMQGEDFHASRDAHRFPVSVYIVTRSIDAKTEDNG